MAEDRRGTTRAALTPIGFVLRAATVAALVWLAGSSTLSPRLGAEGAPDGLSVYYLPQAILFFAFFRARSASSAAAAATGFLAASFAPAAAADRDLAAVAVFLAVDLASAALLAALARAIRAGRFGRRTPARAFAHVGAMFAVSALAAAVATALAPGLAASAGLGGATDADFFRQWLLGDATAYASLGAVLMIAGRAGATPLLRPARERPAEFAAATSFMLLAVLYDFDVGPFAGLSAPHPALVFVTFPALLWLALRFGAVGACAAILLTAAPAIHLVAAGYGGRWLGRVEDQVALVQAYVLISALAAYLTAALAEQAARRRRMREAALALAARRAEERADFLSAVSHEMRTPLNGVMGFAHLLRNVPESPLPPRARDYARLIEVSAARLAQMVERALSVTAARAAAGAAGFELVAPRELVAAAAARLTDVADARGVRLENAVDAELRLVGAREALDLALLNLLTNACRHAAEGGVVQVSARRVGGEVALSVSDDGPGFPPGFAIGQGRLRRGDAEAGLGLHIVDMMAALHGGRLEIGGGSAQGAVATLVLPAEGPARAVAPNSGETRK